MDDVVRHLRPAGYGAGLRGRLNRELKDILATPEVRSAFETQGMDPATSTPEEFRRLVDRTRSAGPS